MRISHEFHQFQDLKALAHHLHRVCLGPSPLGPALYRQRNHPVHSLIPHRRAVRFQHFSDDPESARRLVQAVFHLLLNQVRVQHGTQLLCLLVMLLQPLLQTHVVTLHGRRRRRLGPNDGQKHLQELVQEGLNATRHPQRQPPPHRQTRDHRDCWRRGQFPAHALARVRPPAHVKGHAGASRLELDENRTPVNVCLLPLAPAGSRPKLKARVEEEVVT